MSERAVKYQAGKDDSETKTVAERYRVAARQVGYSGVNVRTAGTKGEIHLPTEAAKLLGRLLDALAAGRSIRLIADGDELTTVEAAKRIGVSRPFLIAQIETGRLACRMVGTHRRIKVADLDAFANGMKRRKKALHELADQAQKLGMGY